MEILISAIGQLTFNRKTVPAPLRQLPLTCETLPHQFLMLLFVFLFVLAPPPQILVVVEYSRAYSLFGTILAHDIIIHTPLQITRIKLRHSEIYFSKHWATASFHRRVIASGEARSEIWRLFRPK